MLPFDEKSSHYLPDDFHRNDAEEMGERTFDRDDGNGGDNSVLDCESDGTDGICGP